MYSASSLALSFISQGVCWIQESFKWSLVESLRTINLLIVAQFATCIQHQIFTTSQVQVVFVFLEKNSQEVQKSVHCCLHKTSAVMLRIFFLFTHISSDEHQRLLHLQMNSKISTVFFDRQSSLLCSVPPVVCCVLIQNKCKRLTFAERAGRVVHTCNYSHLLSEYVAETEDTVAADYFS